MVHYSIICFLVLIILFIHKEKNISLYLAPIGMAISTYWCLHSCLITDIVIGIESYNFCYLLFLYLTHNSEKLRKVLRYLIILSMLLTSLSFCGVSLTIFTVYKSIGIQFIFIGLLFKLACFPFSFWLIDIYKQLPINYIGLDSGLKLFLILITIRFLNLFPDLTGICVVFGILSILIGGIFPFKSKNIKEFFALLHIGHIGVVLILLSVKSYDIAYYYLLFYVTCVITFFYVLYRNFSKLEFLPFNKLEKIKYRPALIISFLSILGIPPSHMFFAKVGILQSVYGYRLYFILLYFILESVFISIKLRYCFKPYIKLSTIHS